MSDFINVYIAIWASLADYLNDATDIYFLPDGLLYNIGIEYAFIPSEDALSIYE